MTAAKVILFFWEFYFSIISITNLIDLLKHFSIAPSWWKFTSGNYNYIKKVMTVYKLSNKLIIVLFIAAIFIETATAVCFWNSILVSTDQISPRVYLPFSLGMVLFGGFIIMDEVFLSFLTEETHFRIFIALIVSLIFIKYFTT